MPEPTDSAGASPNGDATVRSPADSGPLSRRAMLPPDPSEAAQIVDQRYRIEGELGRGAMGVVYRATELWLERPVALKVITPSLVDDSTAPARFHREAKALASVRSHHVVQVYSFGPHQESYFYAMELVEGRSLKEILAEHRAHGDFLPVHRALTILAQIAEGITAVHTAGIVHRDVKPSNIIIENDTGRPVLVDFGLAAPGDHLASALAVGTPLYMAPEQTGLVAGARVTPRTDVYALGCTAFEMLAGTPPFSAPDAVAMMLRHARDTAPLVSSIRPELAAFDRPIARALAKAPADRYESCVYLTNDLAAVATKWRADHLTSRPPPLPIDRDGPVRVLVVEPDHAYNRTLSQAVALAFHQCDDSAKVQITGVDSADEAVERAEIEPPRLLLVDYDMPGNDGAELVSRLRAVPGAERARVIMLSRRVLAEDRWRFDVLGVRDFIIKPSSYLQLVRIIRKVAERVLSGEPSTGPGRR